MKELRIVLVDEDVDFLRRLDGCLRNRLDLPVSIYDYSDPSALSTYTERAGTAVLIVGEKVLDRTTIEGFERVILLTDAETAGENTAQTDPSGPDRSIRTEHRGGEAAVRGEPEPVKVILRINKYRSLTRLLSEVRRLLMECACAQGVSLGEREGQMRRIGFFTPLSRCLQTTSAMTLARLLAERTKTLFISLDPFAGVCCSEPSGGDLSDLLYFFDCDEAKLSLHLEQIRTQAGPLHVIPPAAGPGILSETETVRWHELFRAIAEHTDYGAIVVDFSICIRGLPELLEDMDTILTLVRQDPLSGEQLTQYDRMLKRTGHEQIASVSHRVMLPVIDRLPADPARFDEGPLAAFWREFLRTQDLLAGEIPDGSAEDKTA